MLIFLRILPCQKSAREQTSFFLFFRWLVVRGFLELPRAQLACGEPCLLPAFGFQEVERGCHHHVMHR